MHINIKALHATYLKFAQAVLEGLEEYTKGEQKGKAVHQVFKGEGYTFPETVQKYNWKFNIDHVLSLYPPNPISEKFTKDPRILECAQMHVDDGIIKLPGGYLGTPSASDHYILSELCSPILLLMQDKEDFAIPSEKEILDAYDKYRSAWMRNKRLRKIHVPVIGRHAYNTLGIKMKFGKISWSDLESPEKEYLWNVESYYFSQQGSYSLSDFSFANSILHGEYETDYNVQLEIAEAPNREIDDELDDIFTALRLASEGNIGTKGYFSISSLPTASFHNDTWFFSTPDLDVHSSINSMISYDLTQATVDEAKRIFDQIQTCRLNGTYSDLVLAMRRFNQSSGRVRADDKLIDFVISLESTLLFETQDELKYRMSLRGAHILNFSGNFDFLGKLYKIRSKIVHEGKNLGSFIPENEQAEFLNHTEELVRLVLKKYLELSSNGITLLQQNKDIDTGILLKLSPAATSDTVILEYPKPYERVGARFVVTGWVPKSWLIFHSMLYNRFLVELIDINGKTFMVLGIDVDTNIPPKLGKGYRFSMPIQLTWMNKSFIEKSQGRITLGFEGHEKEQLAFFPIIIDGFDPEGGVDPEITEKHAHVGEKILQFKEDIKNYYKGIEEIRKNSQKKIGDGKTDQTKIEINIHDEDVSAEVESELHSTRGFDLEVHDRAKQERLQNDLQEKYKDAREWMGPLAGGIDLLPHILSTCLMTVTLWVSGHLFQDIDDTLWENFKKLAKKAIGSSKAKSAKKNEIGLVLKQKNNHKTVVCLFDKDMSFEEIDDASTKFKIVLSGIKKEVLEKEVIVPLVFKFDKSKKEWVESSKDIFGGR